VFKSRGKGGSVHIYTKQITMNLSARILIMRNIPLLKSLTEEQLLLLAEAAEYRKYPKNKLVYDLGCKVTHVFLIEKGSVKLGMLASCGKTLTKDIVYDGEIFSENVFGSQAISREFAETMMETRVFEIPVDTFRHIVVGNPMFASKVMDIIVARLQNLEERLQNFVFRKAKERIVHFIYRSGLRRGIKIGFNECLIDHGMSHREIAFLTDTSRQTVARIMSELKRENYIHYGSQKGSKILIRDMELLRDYRLAG